MKFFILFSFILIFISGCNAEENKEVKINCPEFATSTQLNDVEFKNQCPNTSLKIEEPLIDNVEETTNHNEETEEEIKGYISPTTGEVFEDEKLFSFSVIIENSPEARPQTGLSAADVVYEAKTEGDISRYLALFHNHIPDLIGPVRSSRHYFIPLSEEWNMPHVHFGGSTFAYEYLNKNSSVLSLDGMIRGDLFLRDRTRYAPHNAYFIPNNFKKIDNNQPFEHFLFVDEDELLSSEVVANTISFKYNNFTRVTYKFDEISGNYLRYLNDELQIDRLNEEKIRVENIIFQITNHSLIPNDHKHRINIELQNEGEIVYFINGSMYEGNWKYDLDEDKTLFLNQNNEPINLEKGKTWVQIIDKFISIDIKE